MYAKPIQTRVHFKELHFLYVTYHMGVLGGVFDVVSSAEFFSLFKQFLETEMT